MIRIVDNFLNSITMYRLVLYALMVLFIISITFGLFGLIIYNPLSQIISLMVFVATCYVANKIFAHLFKAPTNIESFAITSLILFFIVPPIKDIQNIIPIIIISIIAMASKYILAINGKHIFNPAAFAVFAIALTGLTGASWWVALPAFTIPTLIMGLLVVRKLRRFSMFFAFFITALLQMLIYGHLSNTPVFQTLNLALTAYPLLFLGTIVLTEPLTTPPKRKLQIIYGIIVGFIFTTRQNFGFLYPSAELALIIGNVFSYIVSSKQRIILTLEEVEKLSPTIYNYVFKPSQKLNFTAGQYIEWTLPHKKADSRGNRRYFTITSSPTEEKIMLGVRIEENGSSFKKALRKLQANDKLSAGSLGGDFVLAKNTREKLVFLAGGIGITPFRSMIRYLLDTNDKRDIVLFHSCATVNDFVYGDVFSEAQRKMGLKIVHMLRNKENAPADLRGEFGHLTHELLKKRVPDYKDRRFYISGSNILVDEYKDTLKKSGVEKKKIMTDYFPGY